MSAFQIYRKVKYGSRICVPSNITVTFYSIILSFK
jgi:hypothetical protein